MNDLHYILDTSIVSQLLKRPNKNIINRIQSSDKAHLLISEAVIYEIERGLIKRQALQQLTLFEQNIVKQFSVVAIDLAQWRSAAVLWAFAALSGKVLSDVDLLIAALAIRYGAVIVSTDRDFSAFPSIPIEDWS